MSEHWRQANSHWHGGSDPVSIGTTLSNSSSSQKNKSKGSQALTMTFVDDFW